MNKNIKTFNLWAEDGRDRKMADNHLNPVNEMIEIIKKETNKLENPFKFLDLGCGNGWVVRKISQYKNCKYAMGIDGAENMIKNAKKKSIGDFQLSNIESFNYKFKFDIIFSMETFYYLNDLNKVFQNIYHKGIKNNGLFILGIDHYKENIPSLNWDKEYNLELNTLSMNEWEDYFLNHGFKNIKKYRYGKNKDWQGTFIIMGEKLNSSD